MADLRIEGTLADQLRDLAEREQRSVEAVLQTLLDRYAENDTALTLSELAQELADADYHSGRHDTASRSREILETEYADYLNRRMREQE